MFGKLILRVLGRTAGGWVLGHAKLIGLGLLALALLGAALKIRATFAERDALLEERQQTISGLVQDVTIAEIEAKTARATVDEMIESQKRIERLQAEALAAQAQIRAEVRAQKAVIEDARRLERLTRAKPGLIERLANKATQERFDELEAAYNQ